MPFSESISQFLMACCLDTLQALWHYLSYLSQKTWAVINLSSGDIKLLVLLGIISLFSLFFQPPVMASSFALFHQNKMKMLFVATGFSAFLLITLTSQSTNINEQKSGNNTKWQLVVFDVGQGLSVLIQRGSKAILYDTGAAYPSGFTMANAVVLPYLQHTKIEQLDKMIISHSDNDHAGGLTAIQESMTINELIYNVNNGKKSEKKSICIQGKEFVWQNLHFKMLWPKNIVGKENDDSCVLLISDGRLSVLLTGDISKKVEAELLQQYPKLSADILVVPHHGSKTSSSDVFITKLKPSIAVVSAGYLNRWHMPVAEVVQRYQQHNIELLNTAESGQIIFNMSKQGISTQSYYHDLWPFWFAH